MSLLIPFSGKKTGRRRLAWHACPVKNHIQQKMAQLGTKNFSPYARKMLIDGYIVHMDTSDIRAQTAELQKIGVNINQIARRINSTGAVYAQDVEDIKGALAQIWQLQRSILSR